MMRPPIQARECVCVNSRIFFLTRFVLRLVSERTTMPRKKLEVNATQEQLDQLYDALEVGTPLTIACQMVGISIATYYYWVAVYSVVVYCKEQDELEEMDKMSKAGISIQEIKDFSSAMTNNRKGAIGTFIEPKSESILQYKNSLTFRRFANEVYEIINKCNQIRSKVIVKHLRTIEDSTNKKKGIAASGSMWFLERTQADFFGRPQDKVVEESATPGSIPSIQVEFVSPDDRDTTDRLKNMEDLVLKELKGAGEA